MTLAYDDAVRKLMRDPPRLLFIGRPISVDSLLEALHEKETFEQVQGLGCGCGVLLNSFICILQMIVVKDLITRPTMLKAFFKRQSAHICPRGAYAADFVLPVALSHPTDRNMDNLLAEDITGIFVQVKTGSKAPYPPARLKRPL